MQREVLRILDEVLSLRGGTASLSRESPLLGAIPELDSMAVAALIIALEDRFGVTITDDDVDASAFMTVGALTDFVAGKIQT